MLLYAATKGGSDQFMWIIKIQQPSAPASLTVDILLNQIPF